MWAELEILMKHFLMTMFGAGLAVSLVGPADAGTRKNQRGGETTAEDQYKTVKAEWKRARSVGGYPDPVTAVISLVNGTLPETAIQPGLNDPQAPEVQNPDRFY